MHLHKALTISLGQEQVHIPKTALRPGSTWDVQRHCNAEWELHFICKGECLVDVDQQQYRLAEGQALLIEPGRYHQSKVLTQEFERFTLIFILSPGSVYQQLSCKTEKTPVFSPDEAISHTVGRITAESKTQYSYSDTYLDALIRCLIVELARLFGIDSHTPNKSQQDPDSMLTQTIDTFFEEHFNDSCGEKELAKQLHFSRRHLVRILKKHYGMSFREKLTQARMDYAAFLLRTTDRPVSSIGADIGYSSDSAFFKVFRRTFGMSPRQYRFKDK